MSDALGDAKRRLANLIRLGIPDGHRRVYGTDFPWPIAKIIYPVFAEIARKDGREVAERRAAKSKRIKTIAEAKRAVESFYKSRRDLRAAIKRDARMVKERPPSWRKP